MELPFRDSGAGPSGLPYTENTTQAHRQAPGALDIGVIKKCCNPRRHAELSTSGGQGELLAEDVAVAGVTREVLDCEQVDESQIDLADVWMRPSFI